MPAPLIELNDVHKAFGARRVLDGVNLRIEKGQVTTIIGKSGVGKSVLLKHIIGLMRPDSGDILFAGQRLADMKRKERKAFKAKVSYMFQSNALFDSLNVFDNVALPLKEKTKLSAAEIEARVLDKIESLELPPDVIRKFPSQLSGGMQKRVALARALVTDPEIVLFDEPTTGLDPIRKNAVLSMIAQYQRKFGFTAVLVSHDIPDVFYISNRIAIIEEGRILFEGTPLELEQSHEEVVEEFLHSLDTLKNELIGLDTRLRLEKRFIEVSENPLAVDPYTVMLITVEDLDSIKEEIGHLAAQYVIEALAQALRKYFGAFGFSGRYSSDKIVTILPRMTVEEAKGLAIKLGQEIEGSDVLHGTQFPRVCIEFTIDAGFAQGGPGDRLKALVDWASAEQEPLAHLICAS